MGVRVVLVHGIRTSATMWRAQSRHLASGGVPAIALDLPGHGPHVGEPFAFDDLIGSIDGAVRAAAAHGPVLLVGHSLGGLLAIAYAGSTPAPPVAGLIAASCTAVPRGAGLRAYRALLRSLDSLPSRGQWLTDRALALTLPPETRADFGAGGYAYDAQHLLLRSISDLDIPTALSRLQVPTWFVNGRHDQLRVHERQFLRLVPHAELIVVPRTTHLVTAMRPRVFNAVLDLAVATIARDGVNRAEAET